jgi:hypothetical protein
VVIKDGNRCEKTCREKIGSAGQKSRCEKTSREKEMSAVQNT